MPSTTREQSVTHLSVLHFLLTGYPLKSPFQISCIFPVSSLSNSKFSLCQFTSFVTIKCIKLTKQTYPASTKICNFFAANILPLELGNLQLVQTKFPVFCQNFQIPCVFPNSEFFLPIFPVFPVLWVSCLKVLPTI